MALKTMNRTIDEVEKLCTFLRTQLEKININTLNDIEAERLDEALCFSSDFHDSLVNDGGVEEDGEDDE